MTKREAAIVSAYTGYLIGSFSEVHKYANELFEMPIFTHEFGSKEMADLLKEKSKPDFISLIVN